MILRLGFMLVFRFARVYPVGIRLGAWPDSARNFSAPPAPPRGAARVAALHGCRAPEARFAAGRNGRAAAAPFRLGTLFQWLLSRTLLQVSLLQAIPGQPPGAPPAPMQTCSPFRAVALR